MLYLILALVIFIPVDALAWGPATHLELSWRVLDNLRLLTPQMAELLRSYPLDFFYGSIAADIVVGKRMTHYLNHCHRWVIGLQVMDRADTPERQSLAWGYLTHLAADVVAHNYYVPYKTILGFSEPGRNHPYWEMRFDTFAPDYVWEIPRRISRHLGPGDDELLKKVLSRQFLTFGMNKAIFNNVLLMGRFKNWQAIVRAGTENNLPAMDVERVAHYKELSFDAVMSVLRKREDAWCFAADPTGQESLRAAGTIAQHLRKLRMRGELTGKSVEELLSGLRPHFAESAFGQIEYDDLVERAQKLTRIAGKEGSSD